jgi:hypothetical protein
MARSTDLFPDDNADAKVQEIKSWLKSKGVGDFDAVSLFCDQLDKVGRSYLTGKNLADSLRLGDMRRDTAGCR